jgi:hypothetical protein
VLCHQPVTAPCCALRASAVSSPRPRRAAR